MHEYSKLVFRSTVFTLKALETVKGKILKTLDDKAPTNAIESLQMIRMQKVILAIGIFSLFDSKLQEQLSCKNGFRYAKKILRKAGTENLLERFENFECGINVLKHGYGRSYDLLVSKSDKLPFRIKRDNENFFQEGDVSEISTLIEVDDQFVINCVYIIEEVSNVINNKVPDCCL